MGRRRQSVIVLANFFTLFWRDLLNAVGLAATLFSLWLTYLQVLKAKTAAEEAEKAARAARQEARETYFRYSRGLVSRILAELKGLVANERWASAELRMADLAEYFLSTTEQGLAAHELQKRIREWESMFRALAIGKRRMSQKRWDDFLHDIQKLLDPLHSPF